MVLPLQSTPTPDCPPVRYRQRRVKKDLPTANTESLGAGARAKSVAHFSTDVSKLGHQNLDRQNVTTAILYMQSILTTSVKSAQPRTTTKKNTNHLDHRNVNKNFQANYDSAVQPPQSAGDIKKWSNAPQGDFQQEAKRCFSPCLAALRTILR